MGCRRRLAKLMDEPRVLEEWPTEVARGGRGGQKPGPCTARNQTWAVVGSAAWSWPH